MAGICTLAVIGDGSVGKSSIISTFKSNGFDTVYRQTVGCDFYEKQISIREMPISLRVWDIGGQSMNSKNLPQYLSSSHVIFIIYDVTNAESFANLEDWLRVAQMHSPAAKIHIVGNKVDLIQNRQVTKMDHEKFVKSNPIVQSGLFMSARSGDNVVKAFYKAAGEYLGTPLTPQELAFFDVVVRAHIVKEASESAEGRTEWADEIEREDRLAEERKNKKKNKGCICS